MYGIQNGCILIRSKFIQMSYLPCFTWKNVTYSQQHVHQVPGMVCIANQPGHPCLYGINGTLRGLGLNLWSQRTQISDEMRWCDVMWCDAMWWDEMRWDEMMRWEMRDERWDAMENLAHPEGSGSHTKCSIMEKMTQQCSTKMWEFRLHLPMVSL